MTTQSFLCIRYHANDIGMKTIKKKYIKTAYYFVKKNYATVQIAMITAADRSVRFPLRERQRRFRECA